MKDGSVLFVQNRGITPAGDIQIKADSLEVTGGFTRTNIRSSIINETLAGNSGNISVTARAINFMDGGSLFSRSFGIGSSGNIDVKARESIKITDFLKESPELSSAILSVSFSPLVTGRSGNINISTSTLSLQNGGILAATTFGKAAAGNLNINADQIEVVGRNPQFFESAIASSTLGTGNAGSIIIDTRSLLVKNQGTIDTSSSSNGDAGSIIINASESVEVGMRGSLGSGTAPNNSTLIAILNLPTQPRGNAGSIIINAPIVKVRDQGQIIVSNSGLGNSGKVSITATKIMLDQKAQVTASTRLGDGGNVILESQLLSLRQGSRITATAGGSGNGGNIIIDSPLILGLENSDITANAIEGKGGNIQINTQSIFGLKYQTALTPGNDITASSEFGINGNVEVNTIGINPTNALNTLPVDVIDSSRQIADRCGAAKTSSFVATGRGGMPQNPMEKKGSDRPWNDLRPLSGANAAMAVSSPTPNQPIVEASAMQADESGAIVLVAPQLVYGVHTSPNCLRFKLFAP